MIDENDKNQLSEDQINHQKMLDLISKDKERIENEFSGKDIQIQAALDEVKNPQRWNLYSFWNLLPFLITSIGLIIIGPNRVSGDNLLDVIHHRLEPYLLIVVMLYFLIEKLTGKTILSSRYKNQVPTWVLIIDKSVLIVCGCGMAILLIVGARDALIPIALQTLTLMKH